MHLVRWALTTGWILIILSLLYDPFTPRFTAPDHPWSPLRIPADCVTVQGVCLNETPYPLGTTLFWGLVVPSGIFILLVFGYFVFCYVNAGNWEYSFSGIWLRQNDQLAQLLRPGFFLRPADRCAQAGGAAAVPGAVHPARHPGRPGDRIGPAPPGAPSRCRDRPGADPAPCVRVGHLPRLQLLLSVRRPAGRCCCWRRPGSSTSST